MSDKFKLTIEVPVKGYAKIALDEAKAKRERKQKKRIEIQKKKLYNECD